jgi:Uma2 family endonuclease
MQAIVEGMTFPVTIPNRSGKQVEILDNPQTLSGENILPEFTLDLTEIFAS